MNTTYKIMLTILLLYSAYTDIKKREIMMIPVYICILIGIIEIIVSKRVSVMTFSGIIPGIIMLIVCFITKQALGEGDAYLVIVIGLIGGIRTAVNCLMIGSIVAAIFSLALILTKKLKLKDSIAYAPFILTGFLGVLVIG